MVSIIIQSKTLLVASREPDISEVNKCLMNAVGVKKHIQKQVCYSHLGLYNSDKDLYVTAASWNYNMYA